MNASAARGWLDARAPGVPPRLLARMRGAVAEAEPAPDVPAQLGEAALSCLRSALAHGADRAAALDLLAADALLTYACEAAAEQEPGALARFTADYGASRLATLLPAS
jgi:hypothetical protein